MISKSIRLSVLAFFLITFVEAQVEELPPEPSEVYRAVDKLWKAKQFDVIQQYLDDLLIKWPDYIPAMIAQIGRLKLDGAQYPEALAMVGKIENTLERDPLSVSPGFYDLFKGYSKRLDDAWLFYTRRGIGKEKRKDRIKIENHWRSNSSWKQELIFLSAPRAAISREKFKIFNSSFEIDDALGNIDTKTLREKTFDLQAPDEKRYAAAAELARRALENGIEGVVDALSHPTAMIIAPHLAKGFWEMEKSVTSEEMLEIFLSNPSIFEGGLLWIIAQAPPENRFYAKNLMDKYAISLTNEADRAYAKVLTSAMRKRDDIEKSGKPKAFNNGGRPSPKGMEPFSRKGNSTDKELEKTNSKEGSAAFWVFIGVLIVFVVFLLFILWRQHICK